MKEIFALDIGTRNVVALIAKIDQDENIEVIDAVSLEHETRAMEDGQIHDISKVIDTVKKAKEILEERNSTKLSDVAVAVAGRSLLTEKGFADLALDYSKEISEQDIMEVELLAIQSSLNSIEEENENYHFVAHTVSEYLLDGVKIKNPKHQKGKELKVEILATFLPKIVVESMFTVTDKLGLKVINLTLEPIAAINVVIPEDMRKLNLALVDIGAGTSDIAITNEGRVVGYGMVPMAGDELSEKIASDFLLDFTEAEKVKKQISNKEEKVVYSDILGMDYSLEKEEIEKSIEEILKELSLKISEKIIEINEKAPQAIIMIGGGSLIKGFREKIADAMGLQVPRVAVRGTEVIKKFIDRSSLLKNAEFVTPVGIAKMASKGQGFKIFNIKVDTKDYRIFSFKENIKLMEALLSSGIRMKDLYSKNGKALAFKLNGKLEIVKGEAGRLAVIKVNGRETELEEEIKAEANIEILRKRAGRDANFRIEDLMKRYKNFQIEINGEKRECGIAVKVNNKREEKTYQIRDSDEIILKKNHIISSFLDEKDLEKDIKIYLNSKELSFKVPAIKIICNGKDVDLNFILSKGDKVETKKIKSYPIKIKDLVEGYENKGLEVFVNDEKIILNDKKAVLMKNGIKTSLDDYVENNDKIEYGYSEDALYIISDIFRFYEAKELLENQSGVLQIKLNSRDAEFTTTIKSGDQIKMYYK